MRRRALFLLSFVVLAGCARNDGRTMADPTPSQQAVFTSVTTLPASIDSLNADVSNSASLTITAGWSPADVFPKRFTCDGANQSPGFRWSGGPAGTVTYAVILTDTDAPSYNHWTVANIPSTVHLLADGWLPKLAMTAANANGVAKYTGPCPPKGSTHHYVLSVYALTQQLEALNGDPAEATRTAIQDAASDMASLNFTYSR